MRKRGQAQSPVTWLALLVAVLHGLLSIAPAVGSTNGYDAPPPIDEWATSQALQAAPGSTAVDVGASHPYDDAANAARRRASGRLSVAPQAVPVGGSGAPRFVSAPEGIIDTAAPGLRTQIDDVVASMRTTGSPPPGVRQGGLPGKPGVYGNHGGQLPQQPTGYYRETDVWPGTGPRGTERLVVGNGGEAWYTPDHHGTFRPL